MTATITAGRITPGVYATVDQRRACLLDLAETVDVEDRRNSPLWGNVLHLIVPTLAGAACTDPMGCFVNLVGAVADFQAFMSNEADWLAEHDRGTSAEVAANVHDQLQGEVQTWGDRLMGRQS